MAISSDGQVLYHPNGSDILALEAHTGRTLSLLRGHFDKVNCCVFHPHLQVLLPCAHSCDKGANSTHTHHTRQELYSGGNDNQLLCWVPSMDEAELVEDEATDEGDERQQSSSAAHTQDVDGDAWSDEEEDEMDG